MTDGKRSLTVIFEMDSVSGKCFTPCPHGKECMVYSYKCEQCDHFFGLIEGTNIIKCTGERIEEHRNNV